jgi:2-hydroxy-6-oxonona-2,4-dienedioate hydrolase
VVWTTDDPSSPVEVGRRIAANIAGSRFALIEKCGHWPQWEAPEEFNRIHVAFMRGEPA